MILKIIIALFLIAVAIIITAAISRYMNKKENPKRTEPIQTFDFNFDKHCDCEHCDHHKKEEEE